MTITQMIEEVKSCSINDRIALADAVLQSINPVDPVVERKWIATAQRRRGEYLADKVVPIASADVFAEVYDHARV